MPSFSLPVLSLSLILVAGDLLAAEDAKPDGKLTETLKVVQLQGGFAGFTGVQYTIAPDGTWSSETLFNDKKTPQHKGKLKESDLAQLGSLLKKYNLSKLPANSGKEPGANPHTISLEYGKLKAKLVGQVPPKLDPKDPAGTVESRFAGIWEGVVGLLAPEASPKTE